MQDKDKLIFNKEHQRILNAYQRRGAWTEAKRDSMQQNMDYTISERIRETRSLLNLAGYQSFSNLHILDIGCGYGDNLRLFLEWGASPEHLAGIDLLPERAEKAKHLNPNIDIRCGSAIELPWTDASFDLVCQYLVFTSILEPTMKQQIASEIVRVLRPGGALLWYDFRYDNPNNADVKGMSLGEIQNLFPGLKIDLRSITLAPPIVRRLPSFAIPILYPMLTAIPLLRTHYLGLLVKN
jgi:SAM-dependent methyltransferase